MPDEEGGRARHLERLRERPKLLEITKNFGIAHVGLQPLDIEPHFGERCPEMREPGSPPARFPDPAPPKARA